MHPMPRRSTLSNGLDKKSMGCTKLSQVLQASSNHVNPNNPSVKSQTHGFKKHKYDLNVLVTDNHKHINDGFTAGINQYPQ